jgi:predicted transcriptional regulator
MAEPKVHLTVRAPAAMVDTLDCIAAAMDRDRSWVVLRALKLFLDGEGAELLEDAEGLAQLARGEGVAFDEVVAEAEAIIAEARARRVKKAG